MELVKVKAHVDSLDVEQGKTTHKDRIGNDLADREADGGQANEEGLSQFACM